jgi:hypothetical protein
MTLAQLIALQTALLESLLADTGTTDSYSIDGQAVSRMRWRQWAIDTIFKLNDLINMMDPYELVTLVT